jgi:pyruvate/2-oxoglutarate dehydrogenase complex dihydrolipoamide acyltransferase (E2) component
MSGEPKQVSLVDLGEGMEEAYVVEFLVAPGDRVNRLAPLMKVETDKAIVEITSPWSGTVVRFLVAPGDWVKVGSPMVELNADE